MNNEMPSISRPQVGFISRILGRNKTVILTLLAMFFLFSGAYALKMKVQGDKAKQIVGDIAVQNEIDPALFQAPDFGEGTEMEAEKAPEPPAADFRSTPPPPPPRDFKADDIFKPVDGAITNQLVAEINRASRDMLSVKVKGRQLTVSVPDPDWINSQDEWNEPQTKTSYPIDMSRVIPVTRNINAVLKNEINSELGGKVMAQIERDVYGGHGRFVLIPAGTEAVGSYSPADKVGQERLSIKWERLITPDGINIHVGNAFMADSMGRAGISGEVDERFWDRFGMPLLMTVFSSATAYAVPVQSEAEGAVVENFSKGSMSMAQSVLEQSLDMKPRIIIPHGARILISPVKDIWFPEAVDGNIAAVSTEEASQ